MVRVTGRPDFVLSCESKKYESLWGYSLGFIGQSLPRSAVFGESSVTSCRMWVLTTHRRSSLVGWDILQSLDQSEGVGSSPGRHSASPPRLPKQHNLVMPTKRITNHSKPFWTQNLTVLSKEVQRSQEEIKKMLKPSKQDKIRCS